MANPTYYKYINYALNQPLNGTPPFPIISKLRAPTTKDIGYPLSTIWIYTVTNTPYLLTSVVAGSANWFNLTTGGGAGTFTSLTVTPGPATITGTTNINTTGSAVTSIGTGGTGAVNIGNATGNTAVTGTLTTSAGITATTGNIVATAGNISTTNGNVVLNGAGTFISLPGPVYIYSGAGAPSAGLALHVGDMYINTTAASAATRLYIATAASTWTNVTCAA